MAWPFSNGEILTATNLNAVSIPNAAICILVRSTAGSISSGADTTISSWDSETLDPLAWHSTGVQPSRITPTIAGYYDAYTNQVWADDAGNDYTLVRSRLLRNGSAIGTFYGSDNNVGNNPIESGSVMGVSMNGTTDYFELDVQQVNTSAGANGITIVWKVVLIYPS